MAFVAEAFGDEGEEAAIRAQSRTLIGAGAIKAGQGDRLLLLKIVEIDVQAPGARGLVGLRRASRNEGQPASVRADPGLRLSGRGVEARKIEQLFRRDVVDVDVLQPRAALAAGGEGKELTVA